MSDPPAISTLTNLQKEELRQLAMNLAQEMNVEELRLARAGFADFLQDQSLSPFKKERIEICGQTVHEEIVRLEAGGKARQRGWWVFRVRNSRRALVEIGRLAGGADHRKL